MIYWIHKLVSKQRLISNSIGYRRNLDALNHNLMLRHYNATECINLRDIAEVLPQRPLQWRHNDRDGVSHHQPQDCLLNRLFRHRWKKTSKLRVTGLCEGNSPVTGEVPAQRVSNAENVSIWWRHYDTATKTMHNKHEHGQINVLMEPPALDHAQSLYQYMEEWKNRRYFCRRLSNMHFLKRKCFNFHYNSILVNLKLSYGKCRPYWSGYSVLNSRSLRWP